MRSRAISLIAACPYRACSLHRRNRPIRRRSRQFDPKEWEVPFGAETRPRDPYADAQGRVWFVGQNGNYVAYLDNKTGKFKRYEIDAGTNPHNLVVEKGMVWFTGNRNNRIVKLDPATGKLTTYMIPDSTVRDPHTMTFDPKTGIAWFTAQQCRCGRPVRADDREVPALEDRQGHPAVRYRARLEGPAVVRPVRHEQDRHDRSEDDGAQGVHAA